MSGIDIDHHGPRLLLADEHERSSRKEKKHEQEFFDHGRRSIVMRDFGVQKPGSRTRLGNAGEGLLRTVNYELT
jgi:hypothetical protein